MVQIVIAALLLAEPYLIAKSRVLCETRGWVEVQLSVGTYTWIDENRLVFGKVRNLYNDQGVDRLCLDLRTGDVKPFAAWTSDARSNGYSLLPQASPDAKHLLWWQFAKEAGTWVVTDVSGQIIGSWPCHAKAAWSDSRSEVSEAHWSADGRSVTESELLWDSKPERVAVWARELTDFSEEVAFPVFPPPPGMSGQWCDAYEVGGGRLVAIPSVYAENGPETIPIFNWKSGDGERIKTSHLRMPPSQYVQAQEISPDRKRIAWLLRLKSDDAESIWTSDIDGSNFREIGVVEFSVKTNQRSSQNFGEVHWVPGSKAISYVFLRKLYEVDAP